MGDWVDRYKSLSTDDADFRKPFESQGRVVRVEPNGSLSAGGNH
jgi:hypothetical protein